MILQPYRGMALTSSNDARRGGAGRKEKPRATLVLYVLLC